MIIKNLYQYWKIRLQGTHCVGIIWSNWFCMSPSSKNTNVSFSNFPWGNVWETITSPALVHQKLHSAVYFWNWPLRVSKIYTASMYLFPSPKVTFGSRAQTLEIDNFHSSRGFRIYQITDFSDLLRFASHKREISGCRHGAMIFLVISEANVS